MSSGREESTSAVTGRIMCNTRSRSLLSEERVSKPTEAMPPVGNHPVRTAKTRSPSASARSGITKSIAVPQGSRRPGTSEFGHSRQQLASNIMLGLLQDSFRRALFNDPAAVHDGNLIGQVSGHG